MKNLLVVLTIGIIPVFISMRTRTNMDPVREEVAFSSAVETAEVIAYRELHLKEGVTEEELEKFVADELTPTFEQYVPGVQAIVMKGERGEKKGVYVLLLVFDSVKTRDFYFPTAQHGETNMPEEALRLWRPGQRVLIEEFDKYTEPLEENLFTDFTVLR
jgi:hypothetical protein